MKALKEETEDLAIYFTIINYGVMMPAEFKMWCKVETEGLAMYSIIIHCGVMMYTEYDSTYGIK